MLHGQTRFMCYLLFELSNRGWDSNVMTQKVECSYQVTPLNQLPQGATAESILCDLKSRFLRQET